jgi:MFS transporter, DHA3 family, tetracycline resistance protein
MDQRRTYIILSVLISWAFALSTIAETLYWIETAGLKPWQLILLGSALEVSVLVFEIPTGVFADRKGRKMSVSLGLGIVTLGFLVQALSLSFIWLVIAQILWGFGYTFISGALDAWVSDETGNDGIEKTYLAAVKWTRIMGIPASVVAIVASLLVSYRFALFIGVGLFFLAFLHSLVKMRETKMPASDANSAQVHVLSGFKAIRKSRLLICLALAAVLLGLHSESVDRLDVFVILERYMFPFMKTVAPIVQIGMLQIIFLGFSYVVTGVMERHADRLTHPAIVLSNLVILMTVGVVMFAFSGSALYGVAGIVIYRMFRAGLEPLYASMIVRRISSFDKATVMSTFAQLDSVGQLMSGALMASVSILYGVTPTLVLSAVILFLAAVVFRVTEKNAVI